MTLHAAWKMDTEGASAARQEIALIKFYGAKVLHDVVDRALQVHGALGYSTDLPLEAMYRYARAARIYDGPDEVHRQCVARRILRGYEAPADGVPTEHVPTRREEARRSSPTCSRRSPRTTDAATRPRASDGPSRSGGLGVPKYRTRIAGRPRHTGAAGPQSRPVAADGRARGRTGEARPAGASTDARGVSSSSDQPPAGPHERPAGQRRRRSRRAGAAARPCTRATCSCGPRSTASAARRGDRDGAGRVVDVHPAGVAHDRLRPGDPAHAPADHPVRLGHRARRSPCARPGRRARRAGRRGSRPSNSSASIAAS